MDMSFDVAKIQRLNEISKNNLLKDVKTHKFDKVGRYSLVNLGAKVWHT